MRAQRSNVQVLIRSFVTWVNLCTHATHARNHNLPECLYRLMSFDNVASMQVATVGNLIRDGVPCGVRIMQMAAAAPCQH